MESPASTRRPGPSLRHLAPAHCRRGRAGSSDVHRGRGADRAGRRVAGGVRGARSGACAPGGATYMIYEDTGASLDRLRLLADDTVTITPADVTVTGAAERERRGLRPGNGQRDRSSNGRRYVGAVRFTTPADGDYTVDVHNATPKQVLIARPLADTIKAALGWLALAGLGGLVLMLRRRAADRRIGPPQQRRQCVRVRDTDAPGVAPRPGRVRGACGTGTATAGRSTCNDETWRSVRGRPRRVRPGEKAKLGERATDDRLGIDKGKAQAEMAKLTDRLSVLHERLYAEHASIGAAGVAGARRSREGRHDPAGVHRAESAGLRRRVVQGADDDRGRARLPVAHPQRASRTGRHRDLQPLALRGRRRGADRRQRSTTPAQAPVRAHQRVRADAVRRGNVDGEGLPARRQGRAAQPGCRPGSTIPRSAGSSSGPISTTRAQWDDYVHLYDAAISATSTKWAPWYVVPADHKWVSGVAAADDPARMCWRSSTPRFPPPAEDLDGRRHRVSRVAPGRLRSVGSRPCRLPSR